MPVCPVSEMLQTYRLAVLLDPIVPYKSTSFCLTLYLQFADFCPLISVIRHYVIHCPRSISIYFRSMTTERPGIVILSSGHQATGTFWMHQLLHSS